MAMRSTSETRRGDTNTTPTPAHRELSATITPIPETLTRQEKEAHAVLESLNAEILSK
ncbi:MAG: hypothetical protein V2I33_25840 [Kangiellaceae bacterium]|nr:hypothetical protein [Kangiellaceae bacterium]